MTRDIGEPHDHDHSGPSEGGASLAPDEATVGADETFSPSARPLISNQDRTINVPADYPTIQEALDQVPIYLRHVYEIRVDDGSYEGFYTPGFVAERFRPGSTTQAQLKVTGNTTTPSNVTVPYFGGGSCDIVSVQGFGVESDIPATDEDTSIQFYNCNEAALNQIVMLADPDGTNPTYGVVAYNSHMNVNNVDMGASVRQHGYSVKHGGTIIEEPNGTTPSAGNVTGRAYINGGGYYQVHRNDSSLTADSGITGGAGGWGVYDADNDAIINVNNTIYLTSQGSRPSPETSYAWYVDNGGGGNTVAWWFTSDGGTNWATL